MSVIVTPEQELTEHQERQRRARKPTLGEVEDAMGAFSSQLLNMYGPVAIELRELKLRVQHLERLLDAGGDHG